MIKICYLLSIKNETILDFFITKKEYEESIYFSNLNCINNVLNDFLVFRAFVRKITVVWNSRMAPIHRWVFHCSTTVVAKVAAVLIQLCLRKTMVPILWRVLHCSAIVVAEVVKVATMWNQFGLRNIPVALAMIRPLYEYTPNSSPFRPRRKRLLCRKIKWLKIVKVI